ncbi:MAG TPA: hypothetical protein VJ724_07475, partial [Tahibacter sp.]|nr:hypothetical protein [Tahibacter sp.]
AGIADAWFDKDVRVEALASTLRCLARGTPVRDLTISIGWHLSQDARHLVSPYGGSLPLNPVERQLLTRVMATPDVLASYAELVDASMHDEDGVPLDRRRLSVLISRLQQKVTARFGSMLPIRVIRGRGLRYQTVQRRRPTR